MNGLLVFCLLAASISLGGCQNTFFKNCMAERSSNQLKWQSVVDFFMIHTEWYQRSLSTCNSAKKQSYCWWVAVEDVVDGPDLTIAKDCICAYFKDMNCGKPTGRKKRQVPRVFGGLMNENVACPVYNVTALAEHIEKGTKLHAADETLHYFDSVVEFVRAEGQCTGACNCSVENIYAKGMKCIDCWITRLASLTRSSSFRDEIINFFPNTLDVPPTTVKCGPDAINIALGYSALKQLQYDNGDFLAVSDIPLNFTSVQTLPPHCLAGPSHNFTFDLLQCGATFINASDKFYFNYNIWRIKHQSSSTILRYELFCMTVSCCYNRYQMVGSPAIMPMVRKVTLPDLIIENNFDVKIILYENGFEKPAPLNPVYKVPDYIFVCVKLTTSLPQFKLQMLDCWVTQNADRTGASENLIVKGQAAGGVYLNEPAVSIVSNGNSQHGQFKFRSFFWRINPDDKLYLHCTVCVCDSTKENCDIRNKRRRRATDLESKENGNVRIVSSEAFSLRVTCELENGGCSDVCTNNEVGVVCSCHPGRILSSNGKTCAGQKSLDLAEIETMQDNSVHEQAYSDHLMTSVALVTMGFGMCFLVVAVVKLLQKKK